MSETPTMEAICPDPPPACDRLAEIELLAFGPQQIDSPFSADYAAADNQHKIDLLRATATKEELKLDRSRIEIEREKAHVESLRQDINARREYSDKIFSLVSYWLAGIFFVVTLSAFWGKLSDTVILALIGGTTVNVLGLFLVVANYLFPKNGKLTPVQADRP